LRAAGLAAGFFAGALPLWSPGFSIERFKAAIRSMTLPPRFGPVSSSVWMVWPLRFFSISSCSPSM
jgi:hypothetical protein